MENAMWKWGTESAMNYTNWDDGQGNSDPRQSYLCLYKKTNKWHDCHGNGEYFNFVCESVGEEGNFVPNKYVPHN